MNNAGAPSNPDGKGSVILDNNATPGKLLRRHCIGDHYADEERQAVTRACSTAIPSHGRHIQNICKKLV